MRQKHHLVEILLRLQDVLFHLVGISLQLLDQSAQIGPAVQRKRTFFFLPELKPAREICA